MRHQQNESRFRVSGLRGPRVLKLFFSDVALGRIVDQHNVVAPLFQMGDGTGGVGGTIHLVGDSLWEQGFQFVGRPYQENRHGSFGDGGGHLCIRI